MHRYILEPYNGRNSRFTCPNCHHNRRTFKRYIDTQNQTYLANHVGRCDRADSCGYHYPPRAWFADGGSGGEWRGSWSGLPGATHHEPRSGPLEPQHTNHFDTLPRTYIDTTTKAYHHNNFITFLTKCFDEATALRMAALYKIGTSKHWPGATIFWQLDINDKLRTGKIMLYNPADGHRVKHPYNHIAWAHSLLDRKSGSQKVGKIESQEDGKQKLSDLCGLPGFRTKGFNLQQCFFGEHLLNTHPFKTVAIAESEKTAIICTFFYPEYIWLAAGSLEGLSRNKCRVLKDRRVILFPDVNGYDKWKLKAHEMNLRLPTTNFTVDTTLERIATPDERTRGIDIADRWIEQIRK